MIGKSLLRANEEQIAKRGILRAIEVLERGKASYEWVNSALVFMRMAVACTDNQLWHAAQDCLSEAERCLLEAHAIK